MLRQPVHILTLELYDGGFQLLHLLPRRLQFAGNNLARLARLRARSRHILLRQHPSACRQRGPGPGLLLRLNRRQLQHRRHINHGQTASHQRHPPPRRYAPRNLPCLIQNSFDPHLDLRCLRHRHGIPRHPAAAPLHGSGHIQQRLSIGATRTQSQQRRVIASLLRQRRQPAFQPPGQRMKPEEAAIHGSHYRDGPVRPPHVRPLMRQYRLQLRRLPSFPTGRQQNSGAHPAHGHRYRNPTRFADRWSPGVAQGKPGNRPAGPH